MNAPDPDERLEAPLAEDRLGAEDEFVDAFGNHDEDVDDEGDGDVVELDLAAFDHGDRRAPRGREEIQTLLRDGELDMEGRLLDASNVTLVGAIRTETLAATCVYKPVAGERPLW
ncbi:MAG: Phosphatidylinositol 3-and 4-kinase, partial [Modestobacter sp.]|nr:Phosphatidylinositol 3-and 4-kinase [Modestobacter sp.]